MSEEDYRIIFSKKLKLYLSENKKNQSDLACYMNVSSSTASDWCNGKKMPRMDKIQSIANWLHIEPADLISDTNNSYYLNTETAAIAQEIFDNKELRMLFDASRDASPEDLKTVRDMMLALKRKERGDTD